MSSRWTWPDSRSIGVSAMQILKKLTTWTRRGLAEIPSVGDVVREGRRWIRSAWRRMRGSQTMPPPSSSSRRAGTAVDSAAAGSQVSSQSPANDPITQEFRRRLVALHTKFGSSSDVDALLRDLAAFNPSMIRQPMGVAQQLLDLLNRENYSGAEIARVIESDPAIAQALLRHANATWYEEDGAPPVASLLAAARRVGAKGVHAAVMSVIMEGGCIRPGAGLDELAKMVWDHMVRVAPMARQLAYGFGADADAAFTLGLCHDVGKLILFERIGELRKKMRREITFPSGFLSAALKDLHEPMGGLAALGWGLPPEFANSIASHHRDPPPDRRDPLSEAIFIVERLDLMIHNEQPFDLEALWKRGAVTVPIETGSRLVEETRQAAVLAALNARGLETEASVL